MIAILEAYYPFIILFGIIMAITAIYEIFAEMRK